MVKLKLASVWAEKRPKQLGEKLSRRVKKEKRVNVLLSGDYINILKNDVSN